MEQAVPPYRRKLKKLWYIGVRFLLQTCLCTLNLKWDS
uniref:Uncharacterized protein n=1 Tax=Anguilla anguilla TaxID=7936 RepID=A0A0E9V3T5_ANGAN